MLLKIPAEMLWNEFRKQWVTRKGVAGGPEAAPAEQAAGVGGAVPVARGGLGAEKHIGGAVVPLEAADLLVLAGAHGRQGDEQRQHQQAQQQRQQQRRAHAPPQALHLVAQAARVGLHPHALHALPPSIEMQENWLHALKTGRDHRQAEIK
jgi:hypothetical protein